MKVKINYSVDLEEIPSKVREILSDVSAQLAFLSNSIPYEPELKKTKESISDLAEKIDKIRRKLFILDSQLEDMVVVSDEWYQTSIALETKKLSFLEEGTPEEAENVESDK